MDNCLRRILKIHWLETISNVEPWQRTKQEPMEIEIKKKAMVLDWAHTPKTEIQHHTTGPSMEFSGQEEKRKAKTLHETRPHNRHRGSGVHMRER